MIAHDLLTKGLKPADYPVHPSRRGPLVANQQRAQMLGLTFTPEMGVEKVITEASVLKEASVESESASAKP